MLPICQLQVLLNVPYFVAEVMKSPCVASTIAAYEWKFRARGSIQWALPICAPKKLAKSYFHLQAPPRRKTGLEGPPALVAGL